MSTFFRIRFLASFSRPPRRRSPILLATLLLVLVFTSFIQPLSPTPATAAVAVAPTNLHVVGSQLVDALVSRCVFFGVNRSGTEYACAQGWGFFDGPSDLASG